MTKLSDILPKKKSTFDESAFYKAYPQYLSIPMDEKYKREGYNQAIGECSIALSQALKDGVLCWVPSSDELIDVLISHKIPAGNGYYDCPDFDISGCAKAILQLLKNKKEST